MQLIKNHGDLGLFSRPSTDNVRLDPHHRSHSLGRDFSFLQVLSFILLQLAVYSLDLNSVAVHHGT